MAAVIRVPELDVREMNLQRSRDRWEREAARRHGETINDLKAVSAIKDKRNCTARFISGLEPAVSRNLFIRRRDDSECDGTSREVNRVRLSRNFH